MSRLMYKLRSKVETTGARRASGRLAGGLRSLALFLAVGAAPAGAATVMHPAIPILDENGNHVLDSGRPYSSKMTCGTGGCHDYDAITSAYHFEMGRDEARDDFGAKHGLSHLVSPGYFGGYACMGGSNPDVLAKKANASEADFADRGSAGWIQRCVSCHTGGGWMEKDRNGNRYDETDPESVAHLDGDYFNRGTDENNQPASPDTVAQWDWKKSGVVEADCFICHADLKALVKTDPQLAVEGSSDALTHFRSLRRYVLANGGYFRYIGTAILEFLNLRNPDDPSDTDRSLVNFSRDTAAENPVHMRRTSPLYALNLDGNGDPILNWNASAFDENGRVSIPMLRFPDNDNCMICHRTSNSRRGFYGFGEDAAMTYDEDGVVEEDYKDDVHKGLTWTENGQTRKIENCNACHSKGYYKSLASTSNVDLDADHNFMKGNSDMDLRNDLDYSPNARSCVYCHDEAPDPAIPSGQENMLMAHLERWKANGDMFGYTESSLTRITQTHLDVVSCQACHITNKRSRRGRPLQILYRYRQEEDGKLRIVPYNPRIRYYWKDRNTGRVLTKTDRNSVFELKHDADGNMYGVIIDPETGQELPTRVSARMSHGSIRFGDPDTYQGFVDLKKVYDKVLKSKGIANPDAVMVWTESNEYVMNHNTRPATESLQCDACHARTARGSFSALLRADGILGEGTIKKVATLADRRMYYEGMVLLDMPYMEVDGDGVITESVADILYATRINPSLTVLNMARATSASGKPQKVAIGDAAHKAGLYDADDRSRLAELMGDTAYVFAPIYGDNALRAVALILPSNTRTDRVFPDYRLHVELASDTVTDAANGAGLGSLVSSVFSLEATDIDGSTVADFGGTRVLVKIPYGGSGEDIKVITSPDGTAWNEIPSSDIVMVQPQTAEEDGFVMFWTAHFSYYGVADASVPAAADIAPSEDAEAEADSGSGGGGAVSWLLLAAGVPLLFRRRRP